MGGSAKDWEDSGVISLLTSQGVPVKAYSFSDSWADMYTLARELGDDSYHSGPLGKSWLEKVKEEYAAEGITVNKFRLVGFSAGGLISRRYLMSPYYNNNVELLVTENTPNAGAPMAKLVELGGKLDIIRETAIYLTVLGSATLLFNPVGIAILQAGLAYYEMYGLVWFILDQAPSWFDIDVAKNSTLVQQLKPGSGFLRDVSTGDWPAGVPGRVIAFKGGKPGTIVVPPSPVPVPVFVRSIGMKGQGAGEMRLPVGVAVDSGGRLYVTDTQNHRVEAFNSMAEFDFEFGRHGVSEGNFSQPEGVAAFAPGDETHPSPCPLPGNGRGLERLYVADRMNNRVQAFDRQGSFILAFGGEGAGPGQLKQPSGLAVDSGGHVLVSDTMNDRVQAFDGNGTFLFSFGGSGGDDGRFRQPAGLAVDAEGTVYVADMMNSRIQAFDGEGNFIRALDGGGKLKHPWGVALSPDGTHLYVTDTGNHEVILMDFAGNELARFGGFGSAEGRFHEPHGLAWDCVNKLLYIADTHNNRVQVFGFSLPPALTVLNALRPERLRFPAVPGQAGIRFDLGLPGSGLSSGSPVPPSAGVGVLSVSALSLVPSPFNSKNGDMLDVSFVLGKAAKVTVLVYDKHRRTVRQFTERQCAAGMNHIYWDGMDEQGRLVRGGLYSLIAIASDGVSAASQTAELPVTNKGGKVPGGVAWGAGQGGGGPPDSLRGEKALGGKLL